MKFQLAVIGGGPAGYSAAEAAGKAGLSVVLFEKSSLGGVCLNEGCIPTKTLLYSAKIFDYTKHASKYAVKVDNSSYDLPKIISRKQKVVRKLVLGIKAKMSEAGVCVVNGEAFILDKNTIKCGDEIYECDKMIICTGSETVIPPIEGIGGISYWTHRNALECKELPESLIIIGGGVIGMEFASYFNSLGTKVTVIEMTPEILGGLDSELASMLRAEYTKRGICFMTDTRVTKVKSVEENNKIEVFYTSVKTEGNSLSEETGISEETSIVADKVLLSVGRRPVMKGFGLENLGLETSEHNRIKIDKNMMTSVEGVYVCGDLTGFSMLAHTAVREAEVAVNHICGKPDKGISYGVVPGVVYTNPEIASVGLTEDMLKLGCTDESQYQENYKIIKLPLSYAGRFVAENEGVNGVCKVITDKQGHIIGVHILGNPASELIVMAGMMIQDKRKVEEWKNYIFPHPTVGEIFREL